MRYYRSAVTPITQLILRLFNALTAILRLVLDNGTPAILHGKYDEQVLISMRYARSAPRERVRLWFPICCLLIAACTCGVPARAATGAEQEAAPGDFATEHAPAAAAAESAPAPSAKRHRAPPRPPTTSRLEARVAMLTAQLGLDAKQQAGVRRVLMGQREQVMRVWRDNSVPPADRVGATRAIIERSAGQIRALLNEEQKAKFLRGREPREAQPDAAKAGIEDRTDARSPK